MKYLREYRKVTRSDGLIHLWWWDVGEVYIINSSLPSSSSGNGFRLIFFDRIMRLVNRVDGFSIGGKAAPGYCDREGRS